ncbi:hypothetical protein [uncultured Chitinophaga sp.]|uniref:hypothetical protein n=1 Tax=uncultured Chitinophaga sp. TaxID=339340 RepID=UPI0025E25B1B|nr:hypothetical protein [uncultured Chitinophaga sp.]
MRLKIFLPPYIGCYILLLLFPLFVQAQVDTARTPKSGWFRSVNRYMDSIRSRSYRDSMIKRMNRERTEPLSTDSVMVKSERQFTPYSGMPIRNIYYKKVDVFGPKNITDTTFTTNMKLLKFANRLHVHSQQWVIRQSLFFRERDTINAFEFADNERYLRSRPFLNDARIYVIKIPEDADSVDVLVVTKDVFEYGVDLSSITTQNFESRAFNNNLFGAAQGLMLGVQWHNTWTPQWGSEARYTKYNIGGSFVDASIGYSTVNNNSPLDTNVYEGSYYININRPLYRTSARIAGGLQLARKWSMNIRDYPDSVFRDYSYKLLDAWAGYNIVNRQGKHGSYKDCPNLALTFRYQNLFFDKRPNQEVFKEDPIYNHRHYYIASLVLFKQEFLKSHHFFGFGRTEDIPYGFNANISGGWENWTGRRRYYSGGEIQKYWVTKLKGILAVQAGVSSFWEGGKSADAVLHGRIDYYSRMFNPNGRHRFRQFLYADYLGTPNNDLYKPLNINMEYGVWGFRHTRVNGYARLNLRTETVYYSPWKFFGFKANFFSALQVSQLTEQNNAIFKNPIYAGIGAGCRIRNENLSLNTLKLSANYYPNHPPGMNPLFIEITTITDFRFDIFGIKAPGFLQFR